MGVSPILVRRVPANPTERVTVSTAFTVRPAAAYARGSAAQIRSYVASKAMLCAMLVAPGAGAGAAAGVGAAVGVEVFVPHAASATTAAARSAFQLTIAKCPCRARRRNRRNLKKAHVMKNHTRCHESAVYGASGRWHCRAQ